MSIIEPLIVTATRDDFQLIFAHEDSQDHPFLWDRYFSRENRVHLQKDPFQPLLREIHNGQGERVAFLDMRHNPVNVILFPEIKPDEDEEDYFDE